MTTREWKLAHPERTRELNRASYARRSAKDRAPFRGYTTKLTMERRTWLAGIQAKPCMDCGVQYPSHVMQFDHRDPSTKCFTIAANKCRALTALQVEVEKCDVVCANCHAERTHQRRVTA